MSIATEATTTAYTNLTDFLMHAPEGDVFVEETPRDRCMRVYRLRERVATPTNRDGDTECRVDSVSVAHAKERKGYRTTFVQGQHVSTDGMFVSIRVSFHDDVTHTLTPAARYSAAALRELFTQARHTYGL